MDNGLAGRPEDADVTDRVVRDVLYAAHDRPDSGAAGALSSEGIAEAGPVDDLGVPVGRRVVLGMLGLGVAGILGGAAIQRRISDVLAPIAAADRTGLTGLIPAVGGFRIYTVTNQLPRRSEAEYRLTVTGMVRTPLDLSFSELEAMTPTSITRDFQCVTGWRVPDVPWVGVRLADLLDRAGVEPAGTALTFRSFDGVYTESLTMEQARRDDVLVAYRMLGKSVSSAHGGPVRLYVAPMYGYKSIKWLETIEVVDQVVPGYWERRGYDIDAWVGRSNGRDDAPIS